MSPLVVAQVLPTRQVFDYVIFDEASQILPADAASSLLRGRRAIVAGDPHQLPPTTFFTSSTEVDERTSSDEEFEEDAEVIAALGNSLTAGQESILDVLRVILPPPYGTRTLNWHYRSRDERLISFSNSQKELYDWSLTTFPGRDGADCLKHELVPWRPGATTVTSSPPEEVESVLDLVLDHFRNHPEESLGVIALGSKHAENILEAIRRAAVDSPELEEYLNPNKEEPFFVKNLERVQGDERDAIILAIGYGRTVDGRVRYTFGPLNQAGGEHDSMLPLHGLVQE